MHLTFKFLLLIRFFGKSGPTNAVKYIFYGFPDWKEPSNVFLRIFNFIGQITESEVIYIDLRE